MSKTCAIIPAAGRGLRMGTAKPKQFLELSGRPILLHTLETLSKACFLSGMLVVVQDDFLAPTENLLRNYCSANPDRFTYLSRGQFPDSSQIFSDQMPTHGSPVDPLYHGARRFVTLIVGGAERQDSVFNALQELPDDCDWVLIHDGVRPFASSTLIENTWKAAQKTGAAIAALPATDTIKRVRGEWVEETLPRNEIWLVQTPQVFRKDIVLAAYLEARSQSCSGTDDAFFVERLGLPVTVVRGERSNIKVTTPDDLAWGSWFLAQTGRRESLGDEVG
jgi:2-C-methyl-D-erythritol 4-phosphate cytidylyltransferase